MLGVILPLTYRFSCHGAYLCTRLTLRCNLDFQIKFGKSGATDINRLPPKSVPALKHGPLLHTGKVKGKIVPVLFKLSTTP